MQVIRTWPLSQTAKTSPSHGEDMGSIPVGVTNLAGFLPALLKQVSFSQLVCGYADQYSLRCSCSFEGGGNLAMFPKKKPLCGRFLFLSPYCSIKKWKSQEEIPKKRTECDFSVVLNGEFANTKFRQRKHLFSLPICGTMGLTRSLSLWERWRRSRRRGLDYGMKRPLTRYRGSSPKGRAFGCSQP